MCDYTQVQYCCDHLRFRVQKWCPSYERTHKVCPPNVTTAEYRADEATADPSLRRHGNG
ncbi:hypothetical protein BJ170DRAFT_688070 [Xylariales sp. AK1849]|nr:hypothetical protein BJ170DRAFT_688070 [Xylariales sp. AK1849]